MRRTLHISVIVIGLAVVASVAKLHAADAHSYVVVDTGQVTCYDASSSIQCPAKGGSFFGQDAQHDGNQPSYLDNGDGTVTDLNTGLMWQQGFAADKLTYAEALDYVDQANAQQLAGYSDWRLPSIKQLYSLIDFRGTDPPPDGTTTTGLVPYIDTDIFDFAYGDMAGGERVIDSQWVTTTLYVADSTMMFGVNFADGRIKAYPTTVGNGADKTFYVRLVRGNPEYGINDLVANGDGTVTDRATGLMWSGTDSGFGMTWEDALAWVEEKNAQTYLGHDDWRLPDAKELQSIIDTSRSPDTTGSAAISALFSTTAVSNEYGATDFPFFWSSTTHLGIFSEARRAVYLSFGRGLGYMNNGFVDVHGAGCQRSDPKDGDEADFPSWGQGPQGDVQRVFNFVRLVRDADADSKSTLPYSMWVEIAAHLAGQNGSEWRTDLAIRNTSVSSAEIEIVLHTDGADASLEDRISASQQAVYEDIVGLLGVTGKGALEIRSDQPLAAVARIYNQAEEGSFGQFLAAGAAGSGLSAGEEAWLLGLRQMEGRFRTNLSVTNAGIQDATVTIELYATNGSKLHSYTLDVAPSQVVQDLAPFADRAGRSALGWGFARVNVESGSGVLSSASVVDSLTGDATTVAMQR